MGVYLHVHVAHVDMVIDLFRIRTSHRQRNRNIMGMIVYVL